MKDFSQWFNAQAGAHAAREPWETPAPAQTSLEPSDAEIAKYEDMGLRYSGVNRWSARCRSCERDYELCYDVSEFHEDGNYCGGSERCIP